MGKTMKRIPIDRKPLTLLGKPFRVADFNSVAKAEVYKCPNCGSDVEVQKPEIIEEASLPDLLKALILNMPRQAVTTQDSINAFDFMQQLGESEDGVMKLTDGIYDWIVGVAKKHGPAVYGVNVAALVRSLDNFERTKEKKAKEG
jgi:hypothetical protein